MNSDLKDLLHAKEALKEQIKIQEIGNDSYYLSPLYEKQKQQLYEINCRIRRLQQPSFEEDKLF